MSASLNFSSQIVDNQRVVTFSVVPGSDIPLDIFLYQNTGETTLGEYQAVCSVNEFLKTQAHVGVAIPVFGNTYVRHTEGRMTVSMMYDVNVLKSTIVSRVRDFRTNFLAASSTAEVIIL